MKFHAFVTGLSLIAATAFLPAGEESAKSVQKERKVKAEQRGIAISQEFTSDNSYVAGADAKVGNQKFGSVTEINNHLNYVISPQIKDNLLLRVGVDYERYSFGLPSTEKSGGFYLPAPNTLQSTAMVIGADYTISDQWFMRVEATPGVYSDSEDLNGEDVNVPFIIGGSYVVDKDLQWFFGVSVDLWRDYPVLPGAGVRWKFADQWTLFFVLPKPQLQYEVNERLTLFVGANLKGGSYRMSENFGREHGRNGLNSSIVNYSEVRLGAGATWKALPNLDVNLEGGYIPTRTFDYARANTRVKLEAAPYVELSATAKF
jgi:hypothetical protein